jgi:hypothetical protein
MKHRVGVAVITALMAGLTFVNSARTEPTQADLEKLAADIAAKPATFCPPAASDDIGAFSECADALRSAAFIPL